MRPTEAEIERIARQPYGIVLEYGEAPDEGVLATIVEWPNCFAAGRSRVEAVRELEHALRAMIAFCLEEGWPIPEPAHRYAGKVLLRLARTMHRDADLRAKREGVSLNQWLGGAIARELGGAAALPSASEGQQRKRPSRKGAAEAMDVLPTRKPRGSAEALVEALRPSGAGGVAFLRKLRDEWERPARPKRR